LDAPFSSDRELEEKANGWDGEVASRAEAILGE
jgi:hypothetical protein